MEHVDLVVFDIAGTTLNATDQVPEAFRLAMASVDIAVTDSEIQQVRGRSKREAIADLLNSHLGFAESRDLLAAVHVHFQSLLISLFENQPVEPIKGAEEVFDRLYERKVKIALSTGFDRPVAELIVGRAGWTDRVDALVTNDDVPRGRPAPYLIYRAMEWTGCDCAQRVAAAGDTVSDLQSAANAGIRWGIGVLSGAHSEEQLKAQPHSAIIPSIKNLPGVLPIN